MDDCVFFCVSVTRDAKHESVYTRGGFLKDAIAAVDEAATRLMRGNPHTVYVVAWDEIEGLHVYATLQKGVDYPNSIRGPASMVKYLRDDWEQISASLKTLNRPPQPCIAAKIGGEG